MEMNWFISFLFQLFFDTVSTVFIFCLIILFALCTFAHACQLCENGSNRQFAESSPSISARNIVSVTILISFTASFGYMLSTATFSGAR